MGVVIKLCREKFLNEIAFILSHKKLASLFVRIEARKHILLSWSKRLVDLIFWNRTLDS